MTALREETHSFSWRATAGTLDRYSPVAMQMPETPSPIPPRGAYAFAGADGGVCVVTDGGSKISVRPGRPRRADQLAWKEEPRERFERLRDEWLAEAMVFSRPMDIVTHPAYQQIMAMGPVVVPMILEELRREPNHWFWALEHLTAEDPVPEAMWGNVPAMAQAWLEWGNRRL